MLYQLQGAEDQMSTFEDAAGMRSGYTDQDGAFTVIGIPKKATNVMAEATTGRSNAIEIAAGEDDPPAVTLQLRGFGSIVGKVTVKGQPATGVAITDTPKAGGAQIQIVQSDDTGGFTMHEGRRRHARALGDAARRHGRVDQVDEHDRHVTAGAGDHRHARHPGRHDHARPSTIKPLAGAKVDAAQMFLFNGAVAMTNAKDIQTAFLNGGVTGMKFWIGADARGVRRARPRRLQRVQRPDHRQHVGLDVPAAPPGERGSAEGLLQAGDARCVARQADARAELPAMVDLPASEKLATKNSRPVSRAAAVRRLVCLSRRTPDRAS